MTFLWEINEECETSVSDLIPNLVLSALLLDKDQKPSHLLRKIYKDQKPSQLLRKNGYYDKKS